MNIGKRIRMNRLFSDPSQNLCTIAIDHFIAYTQTLPTELIHMQTTLAKIMAAKPDAVTMHKGAAMNFWHPYAGTAALIIQSVLVRPDDSFYEQAVTPEEAIRLGADALAIEVFVNGEREGKNLGVVADVVRDAARFELPVILHSYPRDPDNLSHILTTPEAIAWAVHCGIELGVDIIKTPYCGDPASFTQIVADCPVPIVAAGGSKTDHLEEALKMVSQVIQCGARGATIGRNAWGYPNITGAVRAFKAVIHEEKSPEDAAFLAAEK
ncbi:MAG TPA: hypothetical protein VIO61_13645 [Anaerolineaceae bacterium]